MRVKPKMSDADYMVKLNSIGLNEDGSEVLDPTPMAPPIGFNKQPSMIDHIRNMVRSEQLRLHAEAQGYESFEDADDFDVPDDIDPASPHEIGDLEPVSVLRERVQAAKQAAEAATAPANPAAAAPAPAAPAPASPPSPST